MLWLALGPFRAMESQVLVIRIKIPNSGAVDWTVHSGPQLLFRDVLDVIGQVLPEATTTAFEYEDEDGDRITVRSDEEMKAMLSYYYSTVMEQQVNGQLIEPLQIFPRACKPPGERNIHGLKVNTRTGPSQHTSPSVSDTLPSNSLKKSSAELKKILANGQMNEQDIRYRDTLGHGNGGTVYKNCLKVHLYCTASLLGLETPSASSDPATHPGLQSPLQSISCPKWENISCKVERMPLQQINEVIHDSL
ncbi:dual specificity mitogen-activated protein kinase kinase 5 isoform X12 [Castor canadensis]|uniref:Dual specificity mitogen-activated protein kinase kinase 5 isoform X12 n=1 Tax=Castor canadensis TaxID=51338 RepID=A0AC58LZ17_CASCN